MELFLAAYVYINVDEKLIIVSKKLGGCFMNLKKRLALITAAVLVFTLLLGSTVYAGDSISEQKMKVMIAAGEIPPGEIVVDDKDVKIKKDEAQAIARKMLEDEKGFDVSYMRLDTNWQTQGKNWTIDFRRNKAPNGNASITIDAGTGAVTGYNIWEEFDGQKNFVANFTRTEARLKAEEFIKNTLKQDVSEFELQKEEPYGYSYRMGGVKESVIYNFNYLKKLNGRPFINSTLTIGVDGTSGKVRNFYSNLIKADSSKLQNSDGVITPEKAVEKYKDYANLNLQYIISYEDRPYYGPKQKVMLVYLPTIYINMVDAKTGEPVGYDNIAQDITSDKIRQMWENPVQMKPDAVLDSKPITEQEGKAKAEAVKKVVEGAYNFSFDDNINKGYEETKYYNVLEDSLNYNWNKLKENTNIGLNVSINSKTGHITNLSLSNWDNSYEPGMKAGKEPPEIIEKVNWEQGKKKALEYLEKLLPGQYGFLQDMNIQEPKYSGDSKKYMRDYNYSFVRVVNGVRFRDNNANVNIDRQTGELRGLYFNWNDADFASRDGIITKEAAVKKYFDTTETKLAYFLASTYNTKENKPIFDEAPKLVYSFSTNGFMYSNLTIDAFTGKLGDWSGREIKVEMPAGEAQLKEHWAKRSVELLIAQGIIKNPNVEYDAKVTRAEAVKMLSLAKGMGYFDKSLYTVPSFKDVPADDDYYSYVEIAVKQKIIAAGAGDFKGSEEITKEEFTKLLVNLIGYSDIARYKDIFKAGSEKNVSDDMTGYIAVCRALNILPVKDGEVFDGKSKLTYAEAASALFKALSFIK